MEAMRIKQRITREGIMIPFHTVQQFQGQRVEIIILPDTEGEPAPGVKPTPFTQALTAVFERYGDVTPYHHIDPVQWQKEIRNEW